MSIDIQGACQFYDYFTNTKKTTGLQTPHAGKRKTLNIDLTPLYSNCILILYNYNTRLVCLCVGARATYHRPTPSYCAQ